VVESSRETGSSRKAQGSEEREREREKSIDPDPVDFRGHVARVRHPGNERSQDDDERDGQGLGASVRPILSDRGISDRRDRSGSGKPLAVVVRSVFGVFGKMRTRPATELERLLRGARNLWG